MLLISLLAAAFSGGCGHSYSVGEDVKFVKQEIKKGETLCIKAEGTRKSLVILHKSAGLNFELAQISDPHTWNTINPEGYIFLEEESRIRVTTNKDTKMVFSTVKIAKNCYNNIWLTNIPNYNLSFSDSTDKPVPRGTSCFFFSPAYKTTYAFKLNMAGDSDSLRMRCGESVTEVDSSIVSLSDTGCYFRLRVDPEIKYGRRVEIAVSGSPEGKPEVPIAGWLGDPDMYVKTGGTAVTVLIVIFVLALIGFVGVFGWKWVKNVLNASKGYKIVPTT